MTEFLKALAAHGFLQNALLTGLLVSVSCGIVGTYVVVRRITYIAGAIAHCVLGGIAVAAYLKSQSGWGWFEPLYGAVASALVAALVIALVSLRAKQREDTIIGALWAVGMSVGVIFLAKTPGYNAGLMSYLFGNILMVSTRDLWLIAGLDVVVAVVGLVFYKEFVAICFDEEFARLRGINVDFYYVMLLCLTALTVVLLVAVVGIVMVIALITLPAAVAGHFSKNLRQMMLAAILLCMAFTTVGLAASYGPDLPTGAVTIVLAGAVYLLAVVVKAVSGRSRRRASPGTRLSRKTGGGK